MTFNGVMDLKTANAVYSSTLSAYGRLVMLTLAYRKYNEHSVCKVTIDELAELCNLSKRKVASVIQELKDSQSIRIEHKGKGGANVYQLCLAGDVKSFDAHHALNDGSFDAQYALNGGSFDAHHALNGGSFDAHHAPNNAHNKEDISNPLISVCVIRDGTHTQFDVDNLAAELGIPKSFVEETIGTWEKTGWLTTKGDTIDKNNPKPWLVAFWKNERDKARYTTAEKPKKPQRAFSAKDWGLCRDCCANAVEGGGCCRGIKVPPNWNETRPYHPQECPYYLALQTDRSAVS